MGLHQDLKTAVFIDSKFVLVRESDIPKLLSLIPGSVGFSGSDNVTEASLHYSLEYRAVCPIRASYVLATETSRISSVESKMRKGATLRIATSYPLLAKKSVISIGTNIKVTEINGSVEAAFGLNLDVDAVMDIVVTGDTLKANGLRIYRRLPIQLDLMLVTGSTPAPSSKALDSSAFDRMAKAAGSTGYTSVLATDRTKLIKKLGEEFAEFIEALCAGDPSGVEDEVADLLYLLQVALVSRGTDIGQSLFKLSNR